jgi:riboflavin kinase/FMN adenylyltransferase
MLVAEGRRHGIMVFSAPRVNLDGEPISSTRIRERIQAGDMKGAAALLGYVYTAEGTVVHGKHLGRTIGFPTLNLGWSPGPPAPLRGLRGARERGEVLRVAARRGQLRPAPDGGAVGRAAPGDPHAGRLPLRGGDMVAVEWVRFLRPEKKFAGIEELKAADRRDVAEARAEFSLP